MAKTTGYKIDFTSNTIIMNYTFAKKANEYGSAEYELLKNIRADFPEINVVVQKGREQKKANKNKRLTYDNMRSYLTGKGDAEGLAKLDKVIMLSAPQKSPYKYVSDWFRKKYPDYKDISVKQKDQKIENDLVGENESDSKLKVA